MSCKRQIDGHALTDKSRLLFPPSYVSFISHNVREMPAVYGVGVTIFRTLPCRVVSWHKTYTGVLDREVFGAYTSTAPYYSDNIRVDYNRAAEVPRL